MIFLRQIVPYILDLKDEVLRHYKIKCWNNQKHLALRRGTNGEGIFIETRVVTYFSLQTD